MSHEDAPRRPGAARGTTTSGEGASHPAEPDQATAAAQQPTESFTTEPVISSESDDPSDSG